MGCLSLDWNIAERMTSVLPVYVAANVYPNV